MAENWYPIRSMLGRWEISNLGYVRNARTKCEPSERTDAWGRRTVCISPAPGWNVWHPVCELMYETLFDREIRVGESIAHQDGNPYNCAVDNLILVRSEDGTDIPLPRPRLKSDELPPFFDRRGIGVHDVYTSF